MIESSLTANGGQEGGGGIEEKGLLDRGKQRGDCGRGARVVKGDYVIMEKIQ